MIKNELLPHIRCGFGNAYVTYIVPHELGLAKKERQKASERERERGVGEGGDTVRER